MKKDIWCCPAELAKCNVFMLYMPSFYIINKWKKIGLGDHLKVLFNYSLGDLFQMWYKRDEFDAEADFLAKKIIRNPEWTLKHLSRIEDLVSSHFTESIKFHQLDFGLMTSMQMLKAWQRPMKWHILQHGISPAINWHADADKERVTKKIEDIIKAQMVKQKIYEPISSVFTILSTPLRDSFMNSEEKEFLKIAEKVSKSIELKKIFHQNKLENLEKKIKFSSPVAYKLFDDHFKKWRWMAYGYNGPAYDLNYYLDRWQTLYQAGIKPIKLLREISNKKKKIREQQNNLLQKLKFNKYQLGLINVAQKMIYIKDYRKGAIYNSMYCYEPFFLEIARRKNLSLDQIRSMSYPEIIEMLKTGKCLKKSELNQRLKNSVIYFDQTKSYIIGGDKAKKAFERLNKEKIIFTDNKSLKGTCACPGLAKGVVKIVETPEDMQKMNQGDVLVSETTYPSLVPAMKKAIAIVTNAGGLTCHAAIVSRELGIPCIVGTKIANKVLKDGNVVEVNATEGVVTKLK